MTLTALFKLALEHRRVTLAILSFVLGLCLLFALVLAWAFHQTDSKLERKADTDRVDVIEKKADVTAQKVEVENAKEQSQQATKEYKVIEKQIPVYVEKAKKAKENTNVPIQKNTKYEEAHREMCLTYPEVCK